MKCERTRNKASYTLRKLNPAQVMANSRDAALGAARAGLRDLNLSPENCSAEDALQALDELNRKNPTLLASTWYAEGSHSQQSIFVREWRTWCAEKKKRR